MIYSDGYNFVFQRRNKELKVACIFDEFTYECFKPECSLMQLTPENWLSEMKKFDPDLLFIESAWAGIDEKWGGKLITAYNEIGELVRYCAVKAVPIVFWNKEDPYGYDTFLDVARLADVVFTTAGECVEKYKIDLGHQNVYFMHFAAQPELFREHLNDDRKDKFCFAGAYYKQFPDRVKIFDAIYDTLDVYKGFDIYDRFYNDKIRAFPKKYQKSVKGTLKFNEIYKAYCGYRYNVNVNTITDSETMFARRVFELMSAKTIVVSNYSRGLVNYFGDLTICTDDPNEMIERLSEINRSEQSYYDFVERCYSRVMGKELYKHRLDTVTKVLFER